MKLMAVTMVKDEADIIRYTLENLLDQGVDEILVADNCSTDGTSEILREIAAVEPVRVEIDEDPAYYQSKKMTGLARKAFDLYGADVVVPFDADEYWTGQGCSLRRALEVSTGPVMAVPLFNYFPSSTDGEDEADPFDRIVNRDREPSPLRKVAVRNIPDLVIEQGNHSAKGGEVVEVTSAMIGHFPWRSYAQFECKVSNGYKAYLATDLPEDTGTHWRSYGRMLESDGPEALRAHYEKWFVDPPLNLDCKPIRLER